MALLSQETFDFVLSNELKRARRSQNFVTVALIQPNDREPEATARQIADLVSRELRETDLLASAGGVVSLVLLDADRQSATRVIDRVMARLEHYQFTGPLHIEVGAACCPADGVDADTLKRVAMEGRTGLTRRPPAIGNSSGSG
jgi:hypothetical protein